MQSSHQESMGSNLELQHFACEIHQSENVLGVHPSTWRIIPLSKWLVTTIYKPFKPFVRGTTLLTGLTNWDDPPSTQDALVSTRMTPFPFLGWGIPQKTPENLPLESSWVGGAPDPRETCLSIEPKFWVIPPRLFFSKGALPKSLHRAHG